MFANLVLAFCGIASIAIGVVLMVISVEWRSIYGFGWLDAFIAVCGLIMLVVGGNLIWGVL